LVERQRRLTFFRPDSLFRAGALPILSGRRGHIQDVGPFLEAILRPWEQSTALAIPNRLSSTGCFFIILPASWPNTRAVLRRNTAISGRSSKRWSSAIWTAATRAAGLPASAVRPVVRNGFSCFPVALRGCLQNDPFPQPPPPVSFL